MDWLIGLGYIGLFIGAVISGSILPFSSDVLLLGVLAAGANPWICFAAVTVGNFTGGMLTYGLGWLGKKEWLEKWLRVKSERIQKQKQRIDKYGAWLVLFSWLPIIGSISVVALGFYKVKPKTIAILLLISTAVRFLCWTLLYVNYADAFVKWVTRFL